MKKTGRGGGLKDNNTFEIRPKDIHLDCCIAKIAHVRYFIYWERTYFLTFGLLHYKIRNGLGIQKAAELIF